MGYLSCKADSAIAVVSTTSTTTTTTTTKTSSSSSSSSSNKNKAIKIEQFHYSDLEAATNGFSDRKLLGKGSHGSVYKAVLRGRHVAIKKPSKGGVEMAPEVDNEIEILSRIRSPRLVNLVGVANDHDKADRLLVVEFMSNGTLYDVLHSNSRPPNWGRRIRFALQVAKAIDILHSQNPPVIHRDIKSANILIDRSFNARLGDFGLALRCGVDDYYRLRSTPPAGTIGYLDPCYVTPDNLSTKTDVFSFGILLLEIITGRKAIDVGHSPPSVVDWAIPLIKKGKLGAIYDPRIVPPKDPVVKKQLALISAKCVRSCRERRPSMKEVVDWLTTLSKLVPLHPWNGFNNPCMMVETMGRPVELRNPQIGQRTGGNENSEGIDAKRIGQQLVRDSRRVHSDLGFRSNLMELMADAEEETGVVDDIDAVQSASKTKKWISTTRFGSERYSNKEIVNSNNRKNEEGFSRLKKNQSVGDLSELVSKTDDDTVGCSSLSMETI